MQDMLIHESGHAVHGNLSFGLHGDVTDFLPPSELNKLGKSYRENLGAVLDSIAKEEGSKISQYAEKNAEEYFAESWLLFVKGGNNNKINKRLLGIFKKISQ